MPPTDSTPQCLKPFKYHGVEVLKENEEEVTCECPFCGKPKFYIGLTQKDEKHFPGGWRCQTCGIGGNIVQFLRLVHTESMKSTKDYSFLEMHRGLSGDAMRAWGICKSFIMGDWLVPGYLMSGEIGNLNKYIEDRITKKWLLIPTATCNQGFFAPMNGIDTEKTHIDICEGVWDAIALWDAYRKTKVSDGEYSATSNKELALISTRNVIGVPGCQTFLEPWKKLTHGKHVSVMYDNDYPRRNQQTGTVTHPGHDGMVKVAGLISEVGEEEKPVSISYLDWSGEGKSYTVNYPDGFDVRDQLTGKGLDKSIPVRLRTLFELVKPVPHTWTEGKGFKRGSPEAKKIVGEKCTSWKQLVNAWKKAMKFTPELEGALAVCMASIASVKYQGKGKLWIQLLSPASTGKTMLCEAMIYAHKYCTKVSDLTSFYSGWAPDGKESKDSSLANRLWDMCMFTLEGDTILKSKYKDIILSQGRELFDGIGGKDYGNDQIRDFRGLLFNWIMCGTNSLRELDTSELGQRFLRYCIMKEIDNDLEVEIARRAIFQEIEDCRVEANCKVESTMSPNYLKAVRLTIGYIEHLKREGANLVSKISFPNPHVLTCVDYSRFISYIRARPSKTQFESAERELAGRLPKQLGRLAQYLALVLQKTEVDSAIMKIIRKVAIDTCDGRTLEIVKALEDCGTMGLDLRGVASVTQQIAHTESSYLEFLTKIKALEKFDNGVPSVAKNQYARWRLTESFRKLYKEVMKGK